MHVAESLSVGSIPSFLTVDDIEEFDTAMAGVYERVLAGALTAASRSESVHSIEGLSVREAMEIYEPAGRDELMTVPDPGRAVLDRAVARAMATIRVLLPSVRTARYWTFVSYAEGQHITPHIDLSDNDSDPAHPKVAGLSICLTDPDAYRGGEFFVETACDPQQWRVPADGGMPTVRPECDESSEWYRHQTRTRWRTRPARGDALVYGSQMTHGTEPVTLGRVSKILGFLVS
jgi:hypothetical protein